MQTLTVNNQPVEIEVAEDMPLLWVIREHLELTGTKFSCGAGLCGACTVLLDGKPVRSCVLPVSQVSNAADIKTIEGIDSEHPVVQAWQQMDVPQCGYCQSGQILATIALLGEHSAPSPAQINGAMTNLCRCGTYPEVKQAIDLSIDLTQERSQA